MRDHLLDPIDVDGFALGQYRLRIHRLSPFLSHHPFDDGNAAQPMPHGHRRGTAYRASRFDIPHDTTLGGYAGSVADRQMSGQTRLPAHHDKIPDPGATRNTDL
jgi:hypothetical protein